MTPLFKKLNLKTQDEIVVLNAPPEFETELETLHNVRIRRSVDEVKEIEFVLAFVIHQDTVNRFANAIAPKVAGDAIVWFAYPKGTSKKYKCEFNRDTGWSALGEHGYEGVRMVAIDQDWSALRFRKVDYIKSMTRDPKRALSAGGKKMAGGRKPRSRSN